MGHVHRHACFLWWGGGDSSLILGGLSLQGLEEVVTVEVELVGGG